MEGPRSDARDAAVRTASSKSGADPPGVGGRGERETEDGPPAAEGVGVRGSVDVPDHTLLRVIGRGAYGEVWLARNALGGLRAVKVVRREDFKESRPFDREFHGIRKYEPISRRHEAFIDVMQVGLHEAEGYFYYVMELADAACRVRVGEEAEVSPPGGMALRGKAESDIAGYVPRTLRHELGFRGRLPAEECLRIALVLVRALEHLHAAGLVHRDVKPSNIVFVEGCPKLADIGLVTEVGDARSVVGTDGYLPPEGAGLPGADVYGLGKVVYEMVTGLDCRRFPEMPGEPVASSDEGLLRELNEVVLRACAWEAARRYPTATDMRVDLERLHRGRSVRSRNFWRGVVDRCRPWVVAAAFVVPMVVVLTRRPSPPPAPPVGAVVERASVFVLPFRLGAGETGPGLGFWPWRMTDAFVDALASLEGVRRCPRRRGWWARPEDELRESLARTNDFRHVLSGELRQREGDVDLRLRLDERASRRIVWQREFQGRTNDMVGLERQAFVELARVLGLGLRSAEVERIEGLFRANEEARRRLVAGWELADRDILVYASYTKVIELAEEARLWDPGCLDVRFMRVSVLRDLALFHRPPSEIWPEILREMGEVVAVDDTDPSALNCMSLPTLLRGWDWVGHDAWVQRELRWEPEESSHMLRALWLRSHGDFEQARVEQAKAEAIGLRDSTQAFFAMSARWVTRDYDEGIRYGRLAIEKAPDRIWPHYWLAQLHVEKGEYDEAFRAIDRVEQVNPVPALAALRAYAQARMGNPVKARETLEDLLGHRFRPYYLQPYFVARVHAALGDPEAAVDWLMKAERDQSEFLVFADWGGLRTDPAWDGMQEHPRFRALLKRVGLDRWPVPIQPLAD